MRPYYQDHRTTLYHASCEEVLPELSGVGQVLTSPPYNMGGTGGSEHRRQTDGYATYDDQLPHDHYVAWQREVLTALWGTLTDDGAIYYNHRPRTSKTEIWLPLELNPGLPLRQIVVWARTGGFNRRFEYYVPVHEWVMIFAKPAFRLNTRSVDDVWRIPAERERSHPAPFPMELARRAVTTTDAAVVLDPFAGSGTTLLAAAAAGRRAIGVERSERYCEQIVMRLTSQESLRARFPDRFVELVEAGRVAPGEPPRQGRERPPARQRTKR